MDFLVRRSAQVQQRHECVQDIRVGIRDEERVDVFPARQPGAPVLLFVHGGWWRFGTRKLFAFCAQGFVERGYTVVLSDYALCPTVGIPDITQATRAAVLWTYKNVAKFNGDPSRIFMAGHSAGGHQVAMMSLTSWKSLGLPQDVLKAVAPISGLFDLSLVRLSFVQPKLQLDGDTVQRQSPLFAIPPASVRLPRMFVAVGDEESVEFLRQSRAYAERWRESGHQVEFLEVPEEDHLSVIFRLADPGSRLCTAMAEFFERG